MRKYFDFVYQINYLSLQGSRNGVYLGYHKTWMDITIIIYHNHVFQKMTSNGIYCYNIQRPLSPPPPVEGPRSQG